MHLVPRLAASAALIPALAGLMLCAATAASGSSAPVDITPNPATAGMATTFAVNCSSLTAAGPACSATLTGTTLGLPELRRGDLVYVTLADRHTGVFRVYAAELYAKSAFRPAIYGPTWWPTLRLITCGGRFDPATGHYLANTVVFAECVGQRG